MADSPRSSGYRMPAEWEPHEGTWLSWPHNLRTWVGNFGPIPHVFVEIVRGLCPYEQVHICVRDSGAESGVRQLLKHSGLDSSAIHFHHIPTNDAWSRDHGPIFIVRSSPAGASGQAEAPAGAAAPLPGEHEARLAVIDWKFNSWGGKYPPWDDDDAVPEKVAALLALPCFHPRMVLEGGSIDVNGQGTLLTTESVLLNPNRNPHLSRTQIEDRLNEYLAARHVIWLGAGISGDDTDGHIDDLARFVAPRAVVAALADDPQDEDYRVLQENFERLRSARDETGAALEVIALPAPGVVLDPSGERLPASYANFYIGNGSVLIPVFGHENDQRAAGVLSELFPGRKVIPIRCNDLVGGYGAIHCVTQQQPLPQMTA